jgi:hypothetical protein
VPIGGAAMLTSKIGKGVKLKAYKCAARGMRTTLKDQRSPARLYQELDPQGAR